MKQLLFVLLAALALCKARGAEFSDADRNGLLQASKTADLLESKSRIPQEVIRACRAASKDDFALADPGEPFQYTDVILKGAGIPALPRRRLVWAVHASNFYVLHYQLGGFAPRYCLVVVSVVKSGVEARIVWFGYTSNNKKIELADFWKGLANGDFKVGNATP